MAAPQNASLGKHANDLREGYAESTVGTQPAFTLHSKTAKLSLI